MDSGSTDQTLNICKENCIDVSYRTFDNHPRQWDAALKAFPITTPWIVGLDADQVVSPELFQMLDRFKNDDHTDIDGIYFNRKNYFRGRWIKHGGYYPVYLLKMFRTGTGFSDLNENMDHRFIVPGKTITWKKGHLLEENFKENKLQFWIEKHNRYSDLLAEEEYGRMQHQRIQLVRTRYWGSPNERKAWLKSLWWQLPKYLRPFLYFGYRMTIQLGFLDGRTGILFHFLQGFWFRLIVDIKIGEQPRPYIQSPAHNRTFKRFCNEKQFRFLCQFPLLFLALYAFNIAFIGVTTPGHIYLQELDKHFNYIQASRQLILTAASTILGSFGYQVSTSAQQLRVQGRGGFNLVYSCLGYGVMSFFAAFVIAFPKSGGSKWKFLAFGLLTIQALNLIRFLAIAIYWRRTDSSFMDHHTIFNLLLYGILLIMIYQWLRDEATQSPAPGNTLR
jgi:exosortase/archaeosortase family protein